MSHYDEETGLIKVSWSKIRVSEECRQKSWLISEGKKSPLADVRGFFAGNVVDQAMRQWLSMDNPPDSWMASHVDKVMDDLEERIKKEGSGVLRWKSRDDRRQVREDCLECALRLEQILRQLVLPHDYQPALRFAVKINIPGLDGEPTPILLNGEMDLLLRSAGTSELRVWDLKMTKDAQYWRKTIAQLTFYDIVCFAMLGQWVAEAGLIQPMVEGVPYLSFRPSDEDRTQMYARIIGVAQAIMRRDYAPKEGSDGCSWCEVRHACVRYAPEPGTRVMPLWG